jgi:hypothetical protein
MNFGRLQIATLWRLAKSDVPCSALVVDGEKALRLIVVEGGQIVQWERFPTAASLRRRAAQLLKQRRRTGWETVPGGPEAAKAQRLATPPRQRTSEKRGSDRLPH